MNIKIKGNWMQKQIKEMLCKNDIHYILVKVLEKELRRRSFLLNL